MAHRNGRHRRVGRAAAGGPRPVLAGRTFPSPRAPVPAEGPTPTLLVDVARALRSPEPVDLLVKVSSLLAVLDPRSRERLRWQVPALPLPSAGDLVGSFLRVDRPETSALLAVMAEMGFGDERSAALQDQARDELARRPGRLPWWLGKLHSVDVHRAVEMAHVLGDGDWLLLGVRLAGRHGPHEMSVVVYVDHNLGTIVKEGYVLAEPIDAFIASVRKGGDDPDAIWRDVDLADTRARISQAIDEGVLVLPWLETDTWPACRPLVEWVCRAMPSGGRGYERPHWSSEALLTLTGRFFASSFGRPFDDDDHRALFTHFLRFATVYGTGDPWHWSPPAIGICLGVWLTKHVPVDAPVLAKAPALLRALVRFADAERDVRAELTDQTLAAVAACEPAFLDAVRARAADGAPGPGASRAGRARRQSRIDRWFREDLGVYVGGADSLRDLDEGPLPDETFAWDGIAGDVRDAVTDVVERCDACCAELLDVEYRTACRRLIHRLAVADPAVFRWKGRPESTAAAVCWIVGRVNDAFNPGLIRSMRVKTLLAHFGMKSTPGRRAGMLLAALGVDAGAFPDQPALGSVDLLVSSRRHDLILWRNLRENLDNR